MQIKDLMIEEFVEKYFSKEYLTENLSLFHNINTNEAIFNSIYSNVTKNIIPWIYTSLIKKAETQEERYDFISREKKLA